MTALARLVYLKLPFVGFNNFDNNRLKLIIVGFLSPLKEPLISAEGAVQGRYNI